MFAYFSTEGQLIGISRNIISNQLPINLQAELKKFSSNGWITELFEFAAESETSYFITVENADQVVQLKSIGSKAWTVYRKFKKA